MRFSLSNPKAIYRTFRSVDLLLVVITLTIELLSEKSQVSMQLSWQVHSALFAFALLSLWNPYGQSLALRRLYVFCHLALVIIANTLFISLELQFYWGIFKACFLLSFPDVILGLVIVGIAHTTNIWFNYPYLVELSRLEGFGLPADPKNLTFSIVSSYIASTFLCLILSRIMLSERESRLRTEALAKEVELLATNVERNRIAREIHDSLGHLLTTLDIQLEVAQKLYSRDRHQALTAIDTAKVLSAQCLQEVRYAVQAIRAAEFDLNQALLVLVERMPPSPQIHTDCQFPPLPLQMSHQLYCIVQEALTNVQRHAQATEVHLYGNADDQSITLQISDNGIGFDRHAPRSGFGLRGMEERVHLMGGELILKTEPSVRIQIKIPRA